MMAEQNHAQDDELVLDRSRDYLLEQLVNLSNETGIQLTLTLYVDGGTFSGILCSGREYVDGFAKLMSEKLEPLGNVSAEQYEEAFKENLLAKYPNPGEEGSEEDYQSDNLMYIHLKNLTVANGEPVGYVEFPYWRFKLDRVSGWILGMASPDYSSNR